MSNYPSTPSRVSRYVPPPAYGGGAATGSHFETQSAPTSSAPFSPASYNSGFTSDYNAQSSYQIPSSSYAPAAFQGPTSDAPAFMSETRERPRYQQESDNSYQSSYESHAQYGSPQRAQYHDYNSHASYNVEDPSLFSRSKRLLERDSSARNIFVSSAILLVYSMIQMPWALIVESHSLFACSFWSLYMCMTLGVTFLVQVISRQKPSETHPFGHGRFEVVASFTNGSLIVFAALYVLFEGSEGLIGSEHAHEAKFQLVLGLIGIILHSILATLYPDGLAPRTEAASGLYSSTRFVPSTQLKIKSLVAHLFAPVCVLIGSITGSSFTDGIMAVILSLYMFAVGVPLCWRSGRVLVQAAPKELESSIERAAFEISRLNGVIRVDMIKSHFWTLSPGVHVGTVVIICDENADDQFIIASAQQILKPVVYHLTIQVCPESHLQMEHDHHDHDHDHDHGHDHDHDHEHDHDHGHHHNHNHSGHNHTHSHSHQSDHHHNHSNRNNHHSDHDHHHGHNHQEESNRFSSHSHSHSHSHGSNQHKHQHNHGSQHQHEENGHNHAYEAHNHQQQATPSTYQLASQQQSSTYYQPPAPYAPQGNYQGYQNPAGVQQNQHYESSPQQYPPYHGTQHQH